MKQCAAPLPACPGGVEGDAGKRSRVKFDFNFFRSISARSLSASAENLPFVNVFLSVQLFIARLFPFAHINETLERSLLCCSPTESSSQREIIFRLTIPV